MRIAIVGSGVAGLVAAHRLHRTHDITVLEAGDRIGGHVHTWDIPLAGRTWSVDSGFIVCNRPNYPEFFRLLEAIGVATQPTTMSFSVRHDDARVEYNGSSRRQLFARPSNALRPAFLWMIREVLRFNRTAPEAVRQGPADLTLGQLLTDGGYSSAFRDWYLLPMGSAIWSLPSARVLAMPARFFVEFFDNHGMLIVGERPQWRTIVGGSRRYVDALIAPFADRVHTRRRVRRVLRFPTHVEVDGERFDRVILACHSDQALALLADATPAEREVLSALPFQANHATLHTDTSILPRRGTAWGAWNYRIERDPDAPAVVTYNMNMLQSLDAPETFCVTLNGDHRIDPARIIGQVRYDHPMATLDGVAARARRGDISGVNRTHYCGAWWGNGFHEDGVVAGLAAADEVVQALRTAEVAA